jgi:N-acylneuraminate cytidylyltransferase
MFAGKPMIAHSILAAQKSEIFDHVYVSTEDKEIIEISMKYGAEIIYRPENLSEDYTPTIPVIRHAIKWMSDNDLNTKAVCCIYATAPFIKKEDLIRGYETFKEDKWNFVFSATKFSYPIQRAFMKLETGGVKMFKPKHFQSRSQDLVEAYHDAGQFYWGKPAAWLKIEQLFDPDSTICELPIWRVQDIDNPEDWERAELLYQLI